MAKRELKPAVEAVEEAPETDEVENVADVLQEAVLYLLAHIYGYDNDLYQRLIRAIADAAAPVLTPDEPAL